MQDRAPRPSKKSVNLSLDAALLAEAKAAGTNLSAVLEKALTEELKAVRESRWREDNRAAIEASNQHLNMHGLPLAKYRLW